MLMTPEEFDEVTQLAPRTGLGKARQRKLDEHKLDARPTFHHPTLALACCKVGLDRPLIPTAFVANLFRSARVSRPLP
jgi:hypothetical protein